MEDPDSPWAGIDADSLHRVEDPAQAAIVADPIRSGFLRPFLGRGLSVSEAAAEIGCRPDTMLYRVRRMHAAGLLRIVETRKRPGRTIKIYQSVHEGYFVPNETMPYDDLKHRMTRQGHGIFDQLIDAYTAVLVRSGNSGRVLARDRNGSVWSSDLPPATNHRGQPALLTDALVWLTRDEATQIRRILASALDRETPSPSKINKQPYIVYRAILPIATVGKARTAHRD